MQNMFSLMHHISISAVFKLKWGRSYLEENWVGRTCRSTACYFHFVNSNYKIVYAFFFFFCHIYLPFISYLNHAGISLFYCYQFVWYFVPSDNIKEVNQIQHSVSTEKNQASSLASDERLAFVEWLISFSPPPPTECSLI